jgi:hypothetical protein
MPNLLPSPLLQKHEAEVMLRMGETGGKIWEHPRHPRWAVQAHAYHKAVNDLWNLKAEACAADIEYHILRQKLWKLDTGDRAYNPEYRGVIRYAEDAMYYAEDVLEAAKKAYEEGVRKADELLVSWEKYRREQFGY